MIETLRRAGILTTLAALAAAVVVPMTALADSAPEGYIIHPNDVLNIEVFGDTTLSQTVTVLPSGDIDYPLIGRVHLAGETPDQAAATLTKALHKYVINPHVNVAISQQGQIDVLVLGGVEHPGKYELSSNATMVDAIAAAGGLTGTAQAWPTARVTDYAGRPTEVSLQKIYHDGDLSGNVPVTQGSLVYVPSPVTIDVEVTGAVDHPGEVELSEGDRLSMAIAKAGNSPTADSDLNHIVVTRPSTEGKSQQFSVDLYDELQHGDVGKDLVMEKGDVVFVPRSKHGIAGTPGDSSVNPVYLILLGLRNLFGHI